MTGAKSRSADPVARNVLSEQVKDRILQWIAEGDLALGSRIVETRVAKDLGVSQAPVREALRDLTTLGIVEMKPYRGASVRQPGRTDLVEAIEVSGELAALAARAAAVRMTEERLGELRTLVGDMDELAEAGDRHARAQKNAEFHEAVVHASGNGALLRAWLSLEPFARTYVAAMIPGETVIRLGDRNKDLIEALEAADPDRAADIMRHHALEVKKLVVEMHDGVFGGHSFDAAAP